MNTIIHVFGYALVSIASILAALVVAGLDDRQRLPHDVAPQGTLGAAVFLGAIATIAYAVGVFFTKFH